MVWYITGRAGGYEGILYFEKSFAVVGNSRTILCGCFVLPYFMDLYSRDVALVFAFMACRRSLYPHRISLPSSLSFEFFLPCNQKGTFLS